MERTNVEIFHALFLKIDLCNNREIIPRSVTKIFGLKSNFVILLYVQLISTITYESFTTLCVVTAAFIAKLFYSPNKDSSQ